MKLRTESTRITRGTAGDSIWETATRQPCELLRPYVRRLVGYDERSPSPQSQRQFPEPFVVMIFEFGPALRVTMGGNERAATRNTGGFVAGLSELYAVTEHEGHQRGIQVDLTPTGARRFLDMPLSEFNGGTVALRDIQPTDHASLPDQLDASPTWESRLDLIETLLARRILNARIDTSRVDWALAQIEAFGGNLKVGMLSHELGYSPKHLISLFRDQVGIPPKLLARLVRFERVMFRLRPTTTTKDVCLADLAAIHGYSDQAHLARDVKHFTGLTASEARQSLSDELVDLFG